MVGIREAEKRLFSAEWPSVSVHSSYTQICISHFT